MNSIFGDTIEVRKMNANLCVVCLCVFVCCNRELVVVCVCMWVDNHKVSQTME